MRVNKLLIAKQILFLFCLVAFLVSCDPDEENAPKTNSNKSTGWASNLDDPGTVQENIVNPFDQVPESQLPKNMDLSQYFPPIGDQGQYGTCVAWATAYNLKTALEAVKFNLTSVQLQNPAFQLSPKYLFTSLPSAEKGADCNGTAFTNALSLMQKKGVATKKLVPYTDLGNCSESNVDPQWDKDAEKHKIKTYRRIDADRLSIKRAIANKMPVVVGCKLDDAFMQWNSEAVYQFSGPTDNVGIHSYHAMCIVGYDDNKGPSGAFKVINSWGSQWGALGYIWVDYNFMVNGFVFGDKEKNLYVAVNDDQKPDVKNPEPVVSSGKNLTAWIFKDKSAPDKESARKRNLSFNIYNTGTEEISASSGWGYGFVYYNAYDAEDYGLVLYDNFDPTAPQRFYDSTKLNSSNGLILNVNIPSKSSFAYEFQEDRNKPNEPGRSDTLTRGYDMPKNLNGYYYTVFMADIYDKIEESDENDNLFYVTDTEPILYTNGVGARKNVYDFDFNNRIKFSKANSSKTSQFRSAVNGKNRNAYTPQEIIYMLNREKRNGNLDRKISAFKNSKSESKILVGSNK
jgi:C1A family cysteine protease